MDSYSTQRELLLDEIDPYSDDYEETLVEAAKGFRSFDEALLPFMRERGFIGGDAAAFLQSRFREAAIRPPRDMAKWFTEHRDISRETAFMLCFAFELDVSGAEDFFRRVYGRERGIDCHTVAEAVYYFCLKNGLTWNDAQALVHRVPDPESVEPRAEREVLYTRAILSELERMTDDEALIDYLTANLSRFNHNNVTAFEYIQRMWRELADMNGLLQREGEGIAPGPHATAEKALSPMEAYLAIFHLDRDSVAALSRDGRSLKPLLEHMPGAVKDAFPDRQGIELILRGSHVSYERVRKWLILLSFTRYWIDLALRKHSYEAENEDELRCLDRINQCLADAGYMELYAGNPYDWLFLIAARGIEPMPAFRSIWGTLMADTIDALAAKNP